MMRETVEMIVKALVDDAEAVDVREVERGNSTTMIEVRVAETDMGKLIGRQGRTVRALRLLAHAASLKKNRRITLEIVE
ncbi:MAG: KH domain-containing protein [Pyrinomonadaceae bacterium]